MNTKGKTECTCKKPVTLSGTKKRPYLCFHCGKFSEPQPSPAKMSTKTLNALKKYNKIKKKKQFLNGEEEYEG